MPMRINRSENAHRVFYHTGLSPQTPALGVRKPFDTYRISIAKLVLTLRNYGPNKRWHFSCDQRGQEAIPHNELSDTEKDNADKLKAKK